MGRPKWPPARRLSKFGYGGDRGNAVFGAQLCGTAQVGVQARQARQWPAVWSPLRAGP